MAKVEPEKTTDGFLQKLLKKIAEERKRGGRGAVDNGKSPDFYFLNAVLL